MNIVITLTKSSIMEDVYKITGYTGSKTGGDGSMDKISSSEDDYQLLDTYYTEAVGALSETISTFGTASENQVFMELPSNWDETTKGSIASNMEKYLVNYICTKWFNLTKKEDVKFYQETTNTLSVSIVRLLCKRKKPQRK